MPMSHSCPLRALATILVLSTAPLLIAGCGKDSSAPTPGSGAAAAPGAAAPTSPYALAAEPKAKALSVLEAKAAGPKKEVVVVGRVREITKGFAAFTLTDVSLTYCGQIEAEGCENPWDYCCHDTAEIAKHTIAVSATKAGEVVAIPTIPELRNLDLVAVVGELTKGADGQPALTATGWYRKERPALPATVRFP